MAMLDVSRADAGGEVAVEIRGSREPARIVPLPFYRRKT